MTTEDQSDERMSDLDKIMWIIEANPQLRSTITVVLLFDRAPDRRSVTQRVERATRRIARLRQRVVSNPYSLAPPRWELDPMFDLAYHLRWSHLGGEGTRDDVLRRAEPIAMQSFDKARPLWEISIIEGLRDGSAAVIAKVHHTVTDGVGGIQLMLELFDLDRDPSAVEMPPRPVGRVLNQKDRFRDALLHELHQRRSFARRATENLVDLARDPLDGVKRSAETAMSALRMAQPTTRPMSPLLEAKSLSVRFASFDRPLQSFRDAAKAYDATLNDIYVTGLCRGLSRWHHQQGIPVSTLRMGMPINARRDDGTTKRGNQFVPARVEVPLDADDVRAHVQLVHERVRAQRDEPALDLIEPLAGMISRLPRFVLTNIFATVLRGQDFLSSNVPGAPIPVYFGGAELTAMVAFGPLSGTALNATLISNRDNVHIGINLDPVAIVDGAALCACLEAGIDEVLALGTPPKRAAAKRAATTTRARKPAADKAVAKKPAAATKATNKKPAVAKKSPSAAKRSAAPRR